MKELIGLGFAGLFFASLIIGFVTIVKWFMRKIFATHSPDISASSRPSYMPSKPAHIKTKLNESVLRNCLEELYFGKEISLETVNKISKAAGIITQIPTSKVQEVVPGDIVSAKQTTKEILEEFVEKKKFSQKSPQSLDAAPTDETSLIPETKEPDKPSQELEKMYKAPTDETPRLQKQSLASSIPIREDSPFLISNNIKTLLVSGSALFLFSAYLFATSYWKFIPDFIKFSLLLVTTIAIYGAGRKVLASLKAPKTAETLIAIAISLIPFNFFAFNILILGKAFSHTASWSSGFLAASATAGFTLSLIPTITIACVLGVSLLSAIFFGSGMIIDAWQWQFLFTNLAVLILVICQIKLKLPQNVKQGWLYVSNGCCGVFLLVLFFATFGSTKDLGGHIPIFLSFITFGTIYAIEARVLNHDFAYLASIFFLLAGAVLSDIFNMAFYQYGLLFVPAGFIMILRAWDFKRKKRFKLAEPYFYVGQLAINISLGLTLFSFAKVSTDALVSTVAVMVMISFCFGILGTLYRQPQYTYASGGSVLLMILMIHFHMQISFSAGMLLFVITGCIYLMSPLLASKRSYQQVGEPLSRLGTATISICLALFAGKWFLDGFGKNFPAEQLNTGILVTILSIGAYSFLGIVRKMPQVFFPILASSSLLYMLLLTKLGFSASLVHAAFITIVSLGGSYIFYNNKQESTADNFRLWGEMVFVFIAIHSLVNPGDGFLAIAMCVLAIVPALWFAPRKDLMIFFVAGIYLLHFIWCRTIKVDLYQYALYLVPLNCGVVTIRTLISMNLPKVPIFPFRSAAIFFSVISLLIAIGNQEIAWQVYLAYGILATVVSKVHYDGKHIAIGLTLLFLACEFFMAAQGVEITEAYSVPMAIYLFLWRNTVRHDPELKKALGMASLVALYGPSFFYSLGKPWAGHGIFLQISSMLVMIWGMYKKDKQLTFFSAAVLVGNGLIQSRLFLGSIPRWIYLGLGGIVLVSLGAMFEFKREFIIKTRRQITKALDNWN